MRGTAGTRSAGRPEGTSRWTRYRESKRVRCDRTARDDGARATKSVVGNRVTRIGARGTCTRRIGKVERRIRKAGGSEKPGGERRTRENGSYRLAKARGRTDANLRPVRRSMTRAPDEGRLQRRTGRNAAITTPAGRAEPCTLPADLLTCEIFDQRNDQRKCTPRDQTSRMLHDKNFTVLKLM